MNNPFQEQLLKAGIVSKEQVRKANQSKNKNRNNQQQRMKKAAEVEAANLKAKQAADKKAERDRQLNEKKEQQARNKAISAEINQLISENCLKRDKECEIAYNFEHRNKVNRIYINADMKSKLVQGQFGIARIEGRYELIPISIAEKIKQRNDKRVIIFEAEIKQESAENDPYADFQIPDDLTW